MKMYELEGELLKIGIAGVGAELKSMVKKATGTEYMWSADPKYWGKTSPVLFPFVGRLKGYQYTYQGKTYKPTPHGFAKDMEFELLSQNADTLHFGIKSSEETKEVYPFDFEFETIYKIKDNVVEITFVVTNTGDTDMYYSLGAHPGFACPLDLNKNKRSDYYIRFENGDKKLDKVVSHCVDTTVGLVNNQYKDYELDNGVLPIEDDMFDNDALVLEGNQVTGISLLDENRNTYVTVEMDAPIYGIWSAVPHGSPFVCIEPWLGRCDAVDYDGKFEERKYQSTLKPGEIFKTSYTITVA